MASDRQQEGKDAAQPTPEATGMGVGSAKTELVTGSHESRKVFPTHTMLAKPVPESGVQGGNVNINERLDQIQAGVSDVSDAVGHMQASVSTVSDVVGRMQASVTDVVDRLEKVEASTNTHHSAQCKQMEKAQKNMTAVVEQHAYKLKTHLQEAMEGQVAQRDASVDGHETKKNSQQETEEEAELQSARSNNGGGNPVIVGSRTNVSASPTTPTRMKPRPISGDKSPRSRSVEECPSYHPHPTKRSNSVQLPTRTKEEIAAAEEGIRMSPFSERARHGGSRGSKRLFQSTDQAKRREKEVQTQLELL